MVWWDPGSSATAASRTLAVSMQSIDGHSSSPKSAIALARSTQGFQTIVERDPVLAMSMRRRSPGSSIVQVASVSR